jgi:hypothetical protein
MSSGIFGIEVTFSGYLNGRANLVDASLNLMTGWALVTSKTCDAVASGSVSGASAMIVHEPSASALALPVVASMLQLPSAL